MPERLIGADPAFYIGHILDSWAGRSDMIDEAARAKYRTCYSDPRVIRSVCEEYRATRTDIEHDQYDQQNNHRIISPVLALWADKGFATKAGYPLDVWRKWADNVTGRPLSCGHFLMEECPDEVANAFIDFFYDDSEISGF